MKKIVVISGGYGSGKTTLARSLMSGPGTILTLADEIRRLLEKQFPAIDWWNRNTEYKNTVMEILEGKTPRQVMVELGNMLEAKNPGWLATKIMNRLYREPLDGLYLVDDLRRLSELEVFRTVGSAYGWRVIHFHIDGGKEEMDHAALRAKANYIVQRGESEPLQTEYLRTKKVTEAQA